MPWVKLTDQLHENDKVGDVSDAAFRLWVLAISWSNKKLTDGHIPNARPARLLTLRDPKKTIAELVEARLWHRASSPCASCAAQREAVTADVLPSSGFVIHHYFGDPETGETYQKTRWSVEAERAEKSRRGRNGGIKSGAARSALVNQTASKEEEANEADRSSGVVKRPGEAVRSSGPLKRNPPFDEAGRSSPYSRSPVAPYPGATAPVSTGGAGGPEDPDEPAIPDAPERSSDRRGTGALRPIGAGAQRVVADARGARRAHG